MLWAVGCCWSYRIIHSACQGVITLQIAGCLWGIRYTLNTLSTSRSLVNRRSRCFLYTPRRIGWRIYGRHWQGIVPLLHSSRQKTWANQLHRHKSLAKQLTQVMTIKDGAAFGFEGIGTACKCTRWVTPCKPRMHWVFKWGSVDMILSAREIYQTSGRHFHHDASLTGKFMRRPHSVIATESCHFISVSKVGWASVG